jgi:hypothetical protein
MITTLLILLPLAILSGWVWYHITWREDWRRLRLSDDWDAGKSRGRLLHGWLR